VKARLLDQAVVAGVGNLLADQTLWEAKISPRQPVDTLQRRQLDRLHRALTSALASALDLGGVHTGRVIEHRTKGGTCPRCGSPMSNATVGGRTTWWCTSEQADGDRAPG
ncbi:MAG: formamidopyrimidine-DNA glycosylase, partial [Actinomycetes bacterium]